jgi:hypothetical protein
VSSDGQPLHMPAQMQGLDRKELMPSGMNTTATHPGMTHPTGVMHQHNPHAALQSDPARTAMHDGSMYAQGKPSGSCCAAAESASNGPACRLLDG